MGVLTVYLKNISNLSDDDHIGQSDPYVKFELEQDNMVFDKDYGKKVSSKKKDELNPVYDEEFHFTDVPSRENMVLKVKVLDDDIAGDDDIGGVKIKLGEIPLGEGPVDDAWVIEKHVFSKHARIYLKLTWAE